MSVYTLLDAIEGARIVTSTDTRYDIILTLYVIFEAAAVAFAILYYKKKDEAKENEDMVARLSSENFNLKLDKKASAVRDLTTPLNTEGIAEFLRNEKTSKVNVSEDSSAVFYSFSDDWFIVDCRRLPQQVCIRIDWNMKKETLHYDIAERVLSKITDEFIMVKASADSKTETVSFYIVSLDHTISAFRMNFDKYMSILEDAVNSFNEQYKELMKIEHPEECPDKQEAIKPDNDTEDIAMRIGLNSEAQRKIKS